MECKGTPVRGDTFSYIFLCRFRWVFCQLEVLRHCLPASIRQTLDQLPESLDDTYLRVLRQIPQTNQAHAHRMLQCLMVAVRPLRVEELAELLAFEFDATRSGIPKYRAAWRLDDQTQAVLSTCSSLVAVIDDRLYGQIVQFSHFSVKEFLTSNRLRGFSRYHIRLASAHTILTQACLGSLLHLDNRIDKQGVKVLPLANYAAPHWVEHARFEDVASRVQDGMETLFDSDEPYFAAWIGMHDINNSYGLQYSDLEIKPKPKPNPLYYSVLCGLYDLAECLAIKHPQYINATFGRYRFPLLAALCENHVEMAELLLEHGADVDVREVTGETMLLRVLGWRQHNLIDIVTFLLKQGTDVNTRDGALMSPLHLAEYEGKLEVAQMLLKYKADVNSQNMNGKTPLHVLLERWRYDEDAVLAHALLLLEHGAEVNRRDGDDQTSLHLAMRRDWFKIVRILLEHGADASVKNNNGKTVLHILLECWRYDEDTVLDHALLLLHHGAKVNGRDKDDQTSLYLAMRRDWFKLVRILLKHGADASAETINGKTPLHILLECWMYTEDTALNHARLLLDHGAEVDRRDKDNRTPLNLAMWRKWFNLVQILLEHGADANANNNGKTPLHILSEPWMYGEEDVLNHARLLLKHGAEVNRRDRDNQTPLFPAIARGWFKIARILLEHGADVNMGNINGKTPLHLLTESQTHDVDVLNHARSLLEHGAEVDRRDEDDQTPLHLAAGRDWFKLAHVLLENGADANAENNNGKTPLHLLSESQARDGDVLDFIWLLLERGAMVNKRDKNNQTPLHLAMGKDWSKLACILLQRGADANAENNNGETSLHILIERQIYDATNFGDIFNHTKVWLEHGVEVNRRHKGNENPLLLDIGMGTRMYKFAWSLLNLMQMPPRRTRQSRPRCTKYQEANAAPWNVVLVLRHYYSSAAWTSIRKTVAT
jgi:ankyrin repeat protein